MSHRRRDSINAARRAPVPAGVSEAQQRKRGSMKIEPHMIPQSDPLREPRGIRGDDPDTSQYTQPISPTYPEGGIVKSGSQRRRQSPLNLPEAGSQPITLPPAAPDAPRPGPPLSYRDPFMGGSRGAPIAPISPVDPPVHNKNSSSRRRSSVPDRSPLQKLEVKLDDISKEEKRARILEVELAAQERAAIARATQRSVRDATSGPRQSEDTSRSKAPVGPNERRHVSAPTYGRPTQSGSEQRPDRAASQRQPPQPLYHGDPTNSVYHRSQRTTAPQGAPRGSSFRERDAKAKSQTLQDAVEGRPSADRVGQAERGLGLGLTGLEKSDRQETQRSTANGTRNVAASTIRADPRTLDTTAAPTRHTSMGANETGYRRAEGVRGKSAKDLDQEPAIPDPLPPKAVLNRQDQGSKYEIPPQTAGGQMARDQVGFSARNPEDSEDPSRRAHHRLAHPFHRHHDHERRYQAPRPLEEWKSGGTASLKGDDLDLDNEEYQAWWEHGGTQRQRKSRSQTGTAAYDVPDDQESAQTIFSPQLFLKSGPLLRFTGIKSQTSSTGIQSDVWRGSVMIVTVDNRSSYQKQPTLRLFKQPMELVPPPPDHIDSASGQKLDPVHVDPLAGQVKVSRSGKTLYAKPVDALEEGRDLSRLENDDGLFEERRSDPYYKTEKKTSSQSRLKGKDGEKMGKYREVKGTRLHAERGVTFWRFNLEIELGSQQTRVAYRINRGPAIGFWVPAKGESMNVMFHSCNGFSLSVNPHEFCGPDPLWRDVLNNHQTRPFHVMIGGGDQIYNDAAMKQTHLFQEWTATKNPAHKHSAPFTAEMQDELEEFYLNRYAMWFSQGLFGMAASQIPMVNIWDDHDIIDGFGSYPHGFNSTPVFTGLGAVAYKFYMLFQHQSLADETSKEEPSWLLGAAPGPYINELSRSVFMSLGGNMAFLGLDCRTERTNDMVLSDETYQLIFNRLRGEIVKGKTKHLLVLLGVPIAYPRYNFLENILTSRLMYPIKAAGRMGLLGNIVNKFDGGVEILDDLDDHWTARHHKQERNYFIQDLQEFAAEKSVRVTILGGDVHLAAVGQFFSNRKLGIPKDRDHRYMPNVVSSAIVNTPPPDVMADVLNKRNKIHHLDSNTDEDMIPMFPHDVDGKPRNNTHLLPRRNWCAIREYRPGRTPPPTPPSRSPSPNTTGAGDGSMFPPGRLTRTLSDKLPPGLTRRLSLRGSRPPTTFETQGHAPGRRNSLLGGLQRRLSTSGSSQRRLSATAIPDREKDLPAPPSGAPNQERPNPFHRRPTGLSMKAALRDDDPEQRKGHINLEHGLDIIINAEVSQKDPAGITTPYRLLVPALDYRGPIPGSRSRSGSRSSIASSEQPEPEPKKPGIGFISNVVRRMSTVARRKPDLNRYSSDSVDGVEGLPPRPVPRPTNAPAPVAAPTRAPVEYQGAGRVREAPQPTAPAPAPDVRRKSVPIRTNENARNVVADAPPPPQTKDYAAGRRSMEALQYLDSRPNRKPIPPKDVPRGAADRDDRASNQMSATYVPGDSGFDREFYYEDEDEDDEDMLSDEYDMAPKRKSWKFWKG